MRVSRKDFTLVVLTDYDDGGDPDSLDSPVDVQVLGVRARVELQIPVHSNTAYAIQEIETPGLWGVRVKIDVNPFEDLYVKNEVFPRECETLEEMLAALHVEVTD